MKGTLADIASLVKDEFKTISTSYAILLVLVGGIFLYGLLYNYMYAPDLVRNAPVVVVDDSKTDLSRCTDCKCAAGPGCPLPYNAAGSGAVSAGHPTADRQNSYSGRRACSVSRTVSASRGVYSSSPSGHSRIIDTLRRL